VSSIESLLQNRIVILDGAMGTMLNRANNDLLNLTEPDVIRDLHRAYLASGADILKTNTFNSNALSMEQHRMEHLVYELNFTGARLARAVADESVDRFVAGVVGPTNRLFEQTTSATLVDAYYEQVRGLRDGGVDLLLIETIFDLENGKAAMYAIEKYFSESGNRVPVMASVTITDRVSMSEFWNSFSNANLLSVGINCSFGARHMRPFLEELSSIASTRVSCHPSAGLPDAYSKPEEAAEVLREFAANGWVNMAGGCCGMTPDHIEAIAGAVKGIKPRAMGRR
jgi:5-methyltetrahydrofolate--homocysteine methyltransferase